MYGYLVKEISSLNNEEGEVQATEAPKTEKPDVKLFIMSYCPYGLQSQKALLPVYDLLKDKTDIGIYFVDYIMHDKAESDENLVQYCIQEEQEDKFSDYVGCFVKEGKSSKCLSETNINTASLAYFLAFSKRFRVPLAFTVKSVKGSLAAQSCEG